MQPELIFCLMLGLTTAIPVNVVQKVTDNDGEKLNNHLPKIDDLSKFQYTFGSNTDSENEIDFESRQDSPKTLDTAVDFVKEGAAAGIDLLKDIKNMFKSTATPEIERSEREVTTIPDETTTEIEGTTISIKESFELDPVFLEDDGNSTMNRTIRQEDAKDDDDIEVGKDGSKEKESQEEEEEEEEPNMITGLISAFLGGLSRPDGSVDVEAITGLLGSLSTQNEDGTYDFNGLTELLMSFFGGTGEDGGGSDFGAFIGGLAGAFLKGIANPPGAKGVGVFLGNLVGAILPGLSAPAPTEEGEMQKPQKPLDSPGFFSGLLSSLFGNLGTLSGSSGGGDTTQGGGNKFSLFKAVFSLITSIFSSSSKGH